VTHTRRTRIAILLIVGSLTGFAPLAIDFYLPGLPQLTSDLGADASTGQLTLTACLLGIALSQVVAGSISDTLGRRRLVLIGLVAFAAASLLCAVAPSIWPLIGLRFAQGCAVGIGFVIARAVVRDLYEGHEAARIFALLVLISGLAPVLAPLAGAQVLLVTSWRGIFVVLAVLALALLAIAVARLPETLADHLRHEPGLGAKLRVYKVLLADRAFMPYASSGSLAFAAMFAYIAGSPFVLENVYGLSPLVYGLVFGANSVGIVACSQVSGRLVAKTGPSILLTAGLASMAAGGVGLLVAIALDLGLAPLLGCLIVAIASIGLIVPNATALALAEQPHAAGSASALFGLGQFGIGAIAAPLVGVAGSHDALPMGIVIAVCGVGALLVERLFAVRAAPGAPRAPREPFEAPVR
jgi:DHA1 family bicyclomycin/chloramphenicol resistance-like MFS transporter